ncbi:MAG: LysR family transcriptional regulator [Clostridia bacterium]|nr:LysR family transcriptional regulator [Clostridia bacterium]
MELTQLQYFVAVAESLHMTRTAERLHVAQPALSQAIRRLERELAVPLFKRAQRRLTLTPYGVYLLERLRGPLGALAAIPAELAVMAQGEERLVRLNVRAATSLVTDAIIAYRQSHADVHFKLSQSEGGADCDISVFTDQVIACDASIPTQQVFEERILLAVSDTGKYAARASVALSELADESFIALAGTRLFRGICDRFCLQAGFVPNVGFESDNPASVKKLIAAHAGVGFWPAFSWGRCEGQGVRVVPITGVDCRRQIALRLYAEQEKRTAVQFYRFLCDFVAGRYADSPEA